MSEAGKERPVVFGNKQAPGVTHVPSPPKTGITANRRRQSLNYYPWRSQECQRRGLGLYLPQEPLPSHTVWALGVKEQQGPCPGDTINPSTIQTQRFYKPSAEHSPWPLFSSHLHMRYLCLGSC